MNRNQNFKNLTLEEKNQQLATLKAEWKELKKQEKKMKEKFYSSPFEKRAEIKRELSSLQKTMSDDYYWGCMRNVSIDVKNEEMIQRLKNPTGSATDPQHLANLIKAELREILNGSRKMETGDRVGDIWESNQGKEFCYFGSKKEIKEKIANLARKRREPFDPDKITTRMVSVKQSDFSSADFNETISLIRQVKDFLEKKDKENQAKIENMKLNNPHLFTQSRCSTDGKYNGRGVWENWYTFHGKRNGHDYTICVPDNHIALTNCLFDNGWGTNSEVGKFFVVEGAAEPTSLYYWNVDKQKSEIVSEVEAQRLEKQGKGSYINYHTYVSLNDKITINHYQESGQQELAKLVSGINQEIENNNHQKNMSGGVITHPEEKENRQLDDKLLLKYFQEHDIKEISLTPEGDLLIKYNSSDKSEVITDRKLQKRLIGYCQENNQTNLSQQDLISKINFDSSTINPKNDNTLLISLGIGGALIIGVIIGLIMRKNKVEKNKR